MATSLWLVAFVSVARLIDSSDQGSQFLAPRSNASSNASALEAFFAESCEDTPGWHNGYSGCQQQVPPLVGLLWCTDKGWTCAGYVHMNFCPNGKPESWAGGSNFHYPEKNCCACGGGCVTEGQTCGQNYEQSRTCCNGLKCEQLLGGSSMKCVKSQPSCMPLHKDCGNNNEQTHTCCDGLECQPLMGGSSMKCEERRPSCVPSHGVCGKDNEQTHSCCNGLQCQQLLGGSSMTCVEPRSDCVPLGGDCGCVGCQELACCEGSCQYPPNSNKKKCTRSQLSATGANTTDGRPIGPN